MDEQNGHALNGVASVDADVAVLAEYQHLQTELAKAQQRVEIARRRIAERDAEIQAALRTELRLAQEELSELAAQHETQLGSLRAATDATVARILAEHPEPAEVAHDE